MGLFSDKSKESKCRGIFSDDRNIDEFMSYITLHPEEDSFLEYLNSKRKSRGRRRTISAEQRDILVKLRNDMNELTSDFPQKVFSEQVAKMQELSGILTDDYIFGLVAAEFDHILVTGQSYLDELNDAVAQYDAVLDDCEEIKNILDEIIMTCSQEAFKNHTPRMQELVNLVMAEPISQEMGEELTDLLASTQSLIDSADLADEIDAETLSRDEHDLSEDEKTDGKASETKEFRIEGRRLAHIEAGWGPYSRKELALYKRLAKKDKPLALQYLPADGYFLYTEAVCDHFELPEGVSPKNKKGYVAFSALIKKWFYVAPAKALDVWHWTMSEFLPFLEYDSFFEEYEITGETYHALENKKFYPEIASAFLRHDTFISLLFEQSPHVTDRPGKLCAYLCKNDGLTSALEILSAYFNNKHTDKEYKLALLECFFEERDYLEPFELAEATIRSCIETIGPHKEREKYWRELAYLKRYKNSKSNMQKKAVLLLREFELDEYSDYSKSEKREIRKYCDLILDEKSPEVFNYMTVYGEFQYTHAIIEHFKLQSFKCKDDDFYGLFKILLKSNTKLAFDAWIWAVTTFAPFWNLSADGKDNALLWFVNMQFTEKQFLAFIEILVCENTESNVLDQLLALNINEITEFLIDMVKLSVINEHPHYAISVIEYCLKTDSSYMVGMVVGVLDRIAFIPNIRIPQELILLIKKCADRLEGSRNTLSQSITLFTNRVTYVEGEDNAYYTYRTYDVKCSKCGRTWTQSALASEALLCGSCLDKERKHKQKKAIKEVEAIFKKLDSEIPYPAGKQLQIEFDYIQDVKNKLSYQYAMGHGKVVGMENNRYHAIFNYNQPIDITVFCKLLDSHSSQGVNDFSRAYKESEDLREYIKKYAPYLHINMVSARISAVIYDAGPLYEQFRERRSSCYAYVKQLRDSAISKLAADGIAVNKWASERTLYTLLCNFFGDAVYQYKPEWLQGLSLDMFVPSKKFAIEYQGRQHYEPVEFFGGEAAFIEQIKRDELKKQLCKENGVKLICWPYNQLITNEELLNEIEKL